MTTRTVSSTSVSISQRIMLGFACMFFGSFLVYGTGLASDGRLHNAAHDTRHAIGFPCH
jgi:cobalt transporter subunit CbtB